MNSTHPVSAALPENGRPRRRPLSLRKKLVFSLLTTVLFFVALEGLLALVGFEPYTATEDPFVGFSATLPLMELTKDNDGQEILTTSQNKLHWFNAQSFPKKKAKGTRRIFCMGGSTTYGHPYWDSTSFSRWLREYLPIVDSTHRWEVINAGGISYASYRVAALMEELVQYEPDLFIVYSVHNEFLERRTYEGMFEQSKLSLQFQSLLAGTRTWSLAQRGIELARGLPRSTPDTQGGISKSDVLPAEVDEVLNHTVGPSDYRRDREWRAKVIRHYEWNLRRMVAIAQRGGAQIVFITPASNEKNCSPFKSDLPADMDAQEQAFVESLLRTGDDQVAEDDSQQFRQELEEAVRRAPECADLQYRLGQHYLFQRRFQDAQQAFGRALNEDICPLRAVEEIRQAVDRVARETGVPLVDFERELRALCVSEHGHPILGEEYFLDHVHPTIDVNRRLAEWIIETLQAQKWVGGTPVEDPALTIRLAETQDRILGELDDSAQGFAIRNLAKVLHWAGKFAEAAPLARKALDLLPNDPESRYVLAGCLKQIGQIEEAVRQYELLFADGDEYPRAYQPYGELLAELGNLQAAKAYLLMSVLRNPKNASAYYSLGCVHLELDEGAFAVEAFEESNRLFPDDPNTLQNLERARELARP